MEKQLWLHLLLSSAAVLGGDTHLPHCHLLQTQAALFVSLQEKCECAYIKCGYDCVQGPCTWSGLIAHLVDSGG